MRRPILSFCFLASVLGTSAAAAEPTVIPGFREQVVMSGLTDPTSFAFLPDGRVIVTQPRRVAARSAARRLAALDGTGLGGRVGYTVRGERQAGPGTLVEFVTPGILLRRLRQHPDKRWNDHFAPVDRKSHGDQHGDHRHDDQHEDRNRIFNEASH